MVVFFSLRGCLVKFWNKGMLLGFDPTRLQDFGTGFWLGK